MMLDSISTATLVRRLRELPAQREAALAEALEVHTETCGRIEREYGELIWAMEVELAKREAARVAGIVATMEAELERLRGRATVSAGLAEERDRAERAERF